jgi:hypothetical protein
MGKLMTGIVAAGLLAGCQGVRQAAHMGNDATALAAGGATPYVILQLLTSGIRQ